MIVISEVRRNMHLPLLILSCVCIAAICLSGSIYVSGDTINIYKLLGMERKELLRNYECCRTLVFSSGIGDWGKICFPLMVSMGFLYKNYHEKQSKMINFYIIRMSKIRYNVNKLVSLLISSVITVVIGYLIYGLILYCKLPAPEAYGDELKQMIFSLKNAKSEIQIIMNTFLAITMYTIFICIFPYFVSLFFNDKYMLFSLPLLMNYVYETVLARISTYAYGSGNDTAAAILNMIDPMTPFNPYNEEVRFLALVFGICILGLIFLLAIAWTRKVEASYGLE